MHLTITRLQRYSQLGSSHQIKARIEKIGDKNKKIITATYIYNRAIYFDLEFSN